ncbi:MULTISPECIES: PIN domain-containing protein [unclassified Adlercreutzia]|uniref:PIN domain-containing protein n=1 Tax=unclassified Adlercreutzia TaxID=2636013 RepID=UPI0013ED2FFC|nr:MULTISPECIES: PIN domain-containing protein [unclassified Adlercreutzia]
MSDRLLIDTNVMLDLAMARHPNFDAAAAIAEAVADYEVSACVCATSLKDLYYVLTKHMGEADARLYVQAVMEDFDVCPVDLVTCRTAITSNEPDFEDGIVRACAETAQVDFIISRDEKAFARSRIKRLSAQEYVEHFL